MDLKQIEEYALANNISVKNAKIDIEIQNKKYWEIFGSGLPQIGGSLNVQHSPTLSFIQKNPLIQQFVLENDPATPFYNPMAKIGSPLAFGLQLANSSNAAIGINQLLFNGTFLVGLKAGKKLAEYNQKLSQQARINLIEQVRKAYFNNLVNQEKVLLFDLNITRLDSLLFQTNQLYKNGFVEQLDVYRLEVALNNLKQEKEKTIKMLEIGNNALKLAMGYPIKSELKIAGNLNDYEQQLASLSETDAFSYNKRIDIELMNDQKSLINLEKKSIQTGYLPAVYGTFNYGVLSAASRFGNMANFSEKFRWTSFSTVGVSVSVPIFDGFIKKYKYDQSTLNEQKLMNGIKQMENLADFEINQAKINFSNAKSSYLINQRNYNLAKEVARVSKIKYSQGAGSNIEILNAESAVKEAQINYFTAFYDLMIAKIDFEKATGSIN